MTVMAEQPVLAATRTAAPLIVARGTSFTPERPVRRRTLILRVFLIGLAVAVVVMIAAGLVARQLAESEAIRDATVRTESIALDVVQPVIGDGLRSGDVTDIRRLDARVRQSVLGPDIARVKVWDANGTIVYSDEPRLIGVHFGIGDDELDALRSGGSHAEISDLDEPENRYERGDGELLEVYQAVRTPSGVPLLFEVYYRYGDVLTSAERIWFGFAGVIAASLLLLLLALLPLLNGLIRTVDRARAQREFLLIKALDASDAERRRLAATVHDGPVQDLIGASYRLGAAAAATAGTPAGDAVEAAEASVHLTVDGLRDMLVDLYPASLSDGGIGVALGDLVAGARSRGGMVVYRFGDDVRMSPDAERLLFRIARETLANGVKHGAGRPVTLRVDQRDETVVLTVRDDGPGFDAAATIRNPPAGHFGLRLLQDTVRESGVDAVLSVESTLGAGTTWTLTIDEGHRTVGRI